MGDRQAWLKLLAAAARESGETNRIPCPNCGRSELKVRYIVDSESRIGYALFWCEACLHGVSVSRVRAPEGILTYALDDPASIAGVPEFIHLE
jgi:hypothetical protein